MRKKKDESILLPADRYWSDKLNIDFAVEFARYAELCGKYDVKKHGVLDGSSFTSYQDWKVYVKEKLEQLNNNEMKELFHYFRNKERCSIMENGITTNMFFPLLIAIYAPMILQAFSEIITDDTIKRGISYFILAIGLIVIIFFIPFFQYLKDSTKDYQSAELRKYFYQDLMGIVSEQIEQKMTN